MQRLHEFPTHRVIAISEAEMRDHLARGRALHARAVRNGFSRLGCRLMAAFRPRSGARASAPRPLRQGC